MEKNAKTDVEKTLLKGPVKQVMEICYKAHQVAGIVVQGKLEVSDFNSIHTFDEKGFKIRGQIFNSYELTDSIFNDRHQPTESLSYKPDGSLKTKAVHTYDEKGNLLTLVCHTP